MEFVSKNDTIDKNDKNDPSINLTNENDISNKLFYFSEISGSVLNVNLYLDKSQITENLNFDCLFPSDSKIEKIYIFNNEYPFYTNDGNDATENISYTKQSFSILIDNSNLNIFSHIKRFEKKVN